LRKLASRATLLNQTVLLKGVNDSAAVLASLSELMFSLGVLPYYLHLLDPVRGTAHFRVEIAQAVAIAQALRASLPGYLVPRLVCEEPGKPGKTLLL
jgi:L-lysine 2,3-aminomutase